MSEVAEQTVLPGLSSKSEDNPAARLCIHSIFCNHMCKFRYSFIYRQIIWRELLYKKPTQTATRRA